MEIVAFHSNEIPEYAILSHTWGTEEVTLEDLKSGCAANRHGYGKILGACRLAFSDEYEWIWIDSCCIDKSSSSELQEAINSMWKWYQKANVCYAYLSDVPNVAAGYGADFQRSRWFRRGWTLQELVAPSVVEFYAKDWSPIGTKAGRITELNGITGIDSTVLRGRSPRHCNSAERMSWAAHREVAREEDIAYCLMGIFDINMQMLYGEGAEKAFLRLQEQILRTDPDYSIFLFTCAPHHSTYVPLLAPNPRCFCRVVDCTDCTDGEREWECFPRRIRYCELPLTTDSLLGIPTTTSGRYELQSTRHGTSINLAAYLTVRKDEQHLMKFLNGTNVSTDESALHIVLLNTEYSDEEVLGLLIEPVSDGQRSFHRSKYPPVLVSKLYLSLAKQTGNLHISVHPITFKQPVERLSGTAVSFELSSSIFAVSRWVRPLELTQSTSERDVSFTDIWPKHAESRLRLQLQSRDTMEPEIVLTIVGRMSADFSICLLAVEHALSSAPGTWSVSDESLSDRHNLRLTDGRMIAISLRRMRKRANFPKADSLRSGSSLPGSSRRYCIRIEYQDTVN